MSVIPDRGPISCASPAGTWRKPRRFWGDRFDFVVHPYGAGTNCFNGEIIPKGVAFGDSMNDAAMLKRAGVSVAMGNACGELKALADVVCEDVAHDGVYLELHRMGLCG